MADDTRVTQSRVGFACAVALLCVIGCSLPAAAGATELIVRRDAGLSAAERAAVRADAGVKVKQSLSLPDTEVVTVPQARAAEALDALNADPDVRYALPNSLLRVAGDLTGSQWALDNPGEIFGAVADADIDAPDAWQVMEGQDVTVAVVDQTVFANHPDFGDRVEDPVEFPLTGSTCTSGVPSGSTDHGTAVAGVIAADGRDRGGTAGVAPLANIVPVRAINNCGEAKLAWVLEGLDQGADRAQIVSASFGSDPNAVNPDMNQAFLDVFDAHPDTLFVVAAGNEGDNVDDPAHPVYPCSTRRPGPPSQQEVGNLICVGMTDFADRPVCWSNVGAASVDVFAPGINILTTVRGGHFGFYGTSMAAPMVAGAAALVLSVEPRIGIEGLVNRVAGEDNVDVKSVLKPISVSGGRLNAARAIVIPSGRYGPGGGEPNAGWVSCDRDHDGVRDNAGQDLCPDVPGPLELRGCPDTDGDGVPDSADNCRSVANADQGDADQDLVGNACDQLPRGDDPDGDGIGALDDRCPTQFGPPPDGCPVVVKPPDRQATPTPTTTPTATPPADPVIVSLGVKYNKCRKGKKCTKVATVTVKLSRQAKVAVKLERRDRSKRGRMVWKRIKSQSLTANARGGTVTVRGKRSGKKSKYRLTATLSGKAKAISFKV
jgi:subtilisin family serine protease